MWRTIFLTFGGLYGLTAPASPPGDLVFLNGAVYEVDAARAWASAVVVMNGRISYVGDNATAQTFIGNATQVVDLRGRMLLPGFQDSHMHPSEYVGAANRLDLQAVVGWEIADRSDPSGGDTDYRMIGRSDGGYNDGMLSLTADMVQHGARPAWLGYLHVADVDVAVKAIEADGGRLLMPRKDLPVGAIAMVADPMGTPFYVMAPIPPPGKPDAKSDVFDVTTAQHVRWNELASPDQPRAKQFYAKHFGFEFKDSMPMGAMGTMGTYDFIDHGGVRLGAIMQKPPQNPNAGWLFYVGVQSITAAKAAIEKGGGKVMNGPHRVPGGDWVVIAVDPQGAAFGVVGPQGAGA